MSLTLDRAPTCLRLLRLSAAPATAPFLRDGLLRLTTAASAPIRAIREIRGETDWRSFPEKTAGLENLSTVPCDDLKQNGSGRKESQESQENRVK